VKHALTSKVLIERYVRAAWILKIRLISARRQLWADQASLIHLESALLQMRKVCEGIAYMCVVASEVEAEVIDTDLRKNYRVGAVFKLLSRRGTLNFPSHARLTPQDTSRTPAVWQLVQTAPVSEEIDRVSKIHTRCGTALHEFSAFSDWPPSSEIAKQHLWTNLNAVRGDHQWLWNRFWQQAITLRSRLFFIDLGDGCKSSQPFAMKESGLVDGDLKIEFDPEYLADFSGALTWSEDPTETTSRYLSSVV
jgi:hypothetical protein